MDKMRLMLAAAVCVVAASLTFASMGSSSPTIPTAMLAQARSAALQVATGMGDSSPTDISMSGIVTRNEALAAVSGEGQISGALGTTSSYLVVNTVTSRTLTHRFHTEYPTQPARSWFWW